jgi:hypothetical protein
MNAEELVEELTSKIIKPHFPVYVKLAGEETLRQITEFDVAYTHSKTQRLLPYDLVNADDKPFREMSVILTLK